MFQLVLACWLGALTGYHTPLYRHRSLDGITLRWGAITGAFTRARLSYLDEFVSPLDLFSYEAR